jgi:hypothetical protein
MPDWPELDGLVRAYPDTLYLVPLDIGHARSCATAAEARAGPGLEDACGAGAGGRVLAVSLDVLCSLLSSEQV